ncbi:MAG: hypothetical protein ACLFQE_06920, partial [Thermotogota bacterium]
YVNGMRYRYVWAPFSVSFKDKFGNKMPAFDEEKEVLIFIGKGAEPCIQMSITDPSEIALLLPETPDFNIGIKDFSFRIGSREHAHPQDDYTDLQ